ncbi:uncharacterized protein LOC135349649 isoform X1 [Halichondria panicea]|uniref:uncharacterized protein LOC135349649 isoform X1 n=1 Tax=Halichondria panicea TaxID=6063 RepID=UPI00312B8622
MTGSVRHVRFLVKARHLHPRMASHPQPPLSMVSHRRGVEVTLALMPWIVPLYLHMSGSPIRVLHNYTCVQVDLHPRMESHTQPPLSMVEARHLHPRIASHTQPPLSMVIQGQSRESHRRGVEVKARHLQLRAHMYSHSWASHTDNY